MYGVVARSLLITVDKRCATITVVLPLMSLSRAVCTKCSDSESSADVACRETARHGDTEAGRTRRDREPERNGGKERPGKRQGEMQHRELESKEKGSEVGR